MQSNDACFENSVSYDVIPKNFASFEANASLKVTSRSNTLFCLLLVMMSMFQLKDELSIAFVTLLCDVIFGLNRMIVSLANFIKNSFVKIRSFLACSCIEYYLFGIVLFVCINVVLDISWEIKSECQIPDLYGAIRVGYK